MEGAMSDLEDTFAFHIAALGLPEPKRQYKFHGTRKFLADFCWPEYRLIVEVNGGTWMQKSGHNTGIGIHRDYEKSNCAQLMGYTYLQFTGKELDDLSAIDTVKAFIARHEG